MLQSELIKSKLKVLEGKLNETQFDIEKVGEIYSRYFENKVSFFKKVYAKTNNLTTNIGMHFIHNLLASIINFIL